MLFGRMKDAYILLRVGRTEVRCLTASEDKIFIIAAEIPRLEMPAQDS